MSSSRTAMKAGPRKINPPRWKPPAISYWTHSIYCYNKTTPKSLPVTANLTRKALRAYFNMLPRDYEDVLPVSRGPPGSSSSLLKAYISDRGESMPAIQPQLMGKISSRKSGFWGPFRRLVSLQPKLVFKHCPEETTVIMFVYDRRIEYLRQRLQKLSKHLKKIRASYISCSLPGAFFETA
jgi:hypothetical protein